MHPYLLGAIALVVLIAAWLIRDEEDEAYAPLLRHEDRRITHTPWCMWTPQHPEDCDCPDGVGA